MKRGVAVLFLLLSCACGPSAGAPTPADAGRCARDLAAILAAAPDRAIDVTLYDETHQKPDVTLRITAREIDLRFLACDPATWEQKRAIRTTAVFLKISENGAADGFRPPGADWEEASNAFWVSVKVQGTQNLRRWLDGEVASGALAYMGERWGLKDYKSTFPPDRPLNLMSLIGSSPSGLYVYIDCLDRDLTHLAFCEMYFGTREGLFVGSSIPASNVPDWQTYEKALTAFLETHVVKEGAR